MTRTLLVVPILILFYAVASLGSAEGVSFTGGDGSSIAEAIVVHAPSEACSIFSTSPQPTGKSTQFILTSIRTLGAEPLKHLTNRFTQPLTGT